MAYEIISAHMKKSASRLKSAKVLNESEFYEEAISTAYYAVFHAISALLAAKNLNFSTHKSVISNFNKIYVHTGLINSISAKALSDLHNKRNESEYDPTVLVGKNGAKEAIQLAEAATQNIIEYCKENDINFDS